MSMVKPMKVDLSKKIVRESYQVQNGLPTLAKTILHR